MYRIKNLLFIIAILFYAAGLAQEEPRETVIINNDTIVIKAIPLVEISQKTEDVYNELKKIEETINSYDDQKSIDSLTTVGKEYIQAQIKRIEKTKNKFSNRELQDEKREWKKVRNNLEEWRKKINTRTETLKELKMRSDLMLKQWKLTLTEAKKQDTPDKFIKGLTSTIKDIEKVDEKLSEKLNQLYLNQNNITEFILTVEEILNELEQVRLSYFEQDAPPIWKSYDTIGSYQLAKIQTRKYLNESSKNLNSFFVDYANKTGLHLFVFIFLVVFLYLLKRFIENNEKKNDINQETARFFISNYFRTALILTLASSAWIYPIRPSIVNDILLLSILVLSLLMFYRLYGKKFTSFLVLLTILALLNEALVLFNGIGLLARVFVYLEIFFTGYVLFHFINRRKHLDTHFSFKVWNILYFFSYIFAVFLFFSFLGNTFGYVSLSILLVNTVVHATITAIIYTLLSMIFDSIVLIAFETKFFQRSNIIRDNKNSLVKSINTITGIIIIGFWVRSILVSLGFNDQFWAWLGGLMESSWTVGTSTISLGAIIGVIAVIVITTVIVRIVSILLNKEIFPRIRLPRGVPGAISMITRYIIVAFGIYFVLAAAGIDLSKFGMIAGALGVGIGFGLQNIVFNFIAGLVLAFERPFQVGDVIEVGKFMGTVTSIGVRSSNIKTYDGSEIIVPNGDLISNDVVNWTLSDRKKRREVPVSVAYGSDPREVLEILSKAAGDHVNVLESPAPWATFEGFGDSSLDFKIRFWVPFDIGVTVKSQVAMSIYDALEEAGINIPFPQQDIYIKAIEDSSLDISKQKRASSKRKKLKTDDSKDPKASEETKKPDQIEHDDDKEKD